MSQSKPEEEEKTEEAPKLIFGIDSKKFIKWTIIVVVGAIVLYFIYNKFIK